MLILSFSVDWKEMIPFSLGKKKKKEGFPNTFPFSEAKFRFSQRKEEKKMILLIVTHL